MRVRILASLLLAGLSLTGFAQLDYHPVEVGRQPEKPKAKSAKLPVWSAKPGATAQLGPEKQMFGWAIRPPKGFVSTQKSEGLNQIYVFQGTPRLDGSFPVMWTVTGDAKRVDSQKGQDEAVMDEYMIQLHQNRDGWKATPSEAGLIQGRKFLRRRWTAIQLVDGQSRRLHGMVYITLTGSKFAAIVLEDLDPKSNTTLPSMELAVLTFRKR